MPIPSAGQISTHLSNVAKQKHKMLPLLKQAIDAQNEKAIYTYENKIAGLEWEETSWTLGNFPFVSPMLGGPWTQQLTNAGNGFV
tara:strand:- start:278 stop:532 length:255 start_codon:yes stop_codon:yes gene_type:complete